MCAHKCVHTCLHTHGHTSCYSIFSLDVLYHTLLPSTSSLHKSKLMSYLEGGLEVMCLSTLTVVISYNFTQLITDCLKLCWHILFKRCNSSEFVSRYPCTICQHISVAYIKFKHKIGLNRNK